MYRSYIDIENMEKYEMHSTMLRFSGNYNISVLMDCDDKLWISIMNTCWMNLYVNSSADTFEILWTTTKFFFMIYSHKFLSFSDHF